MNSTIRASKFAVGIAIVLIAAAAAAGGYWLARHSEERAPGVSAIDHALAGDKKPLYWFDPMQPNQHFDKPGKSPFMDMQLVPKFAEDPGTANVVRIDPRILQNLGVRLTRVERSTQAQVLDAPGTVVPNDRELAQVQARTAGFVMKMHGRAAGELVAQNAPLVDLLVPEWAAAQSEFLTLTDSGDRELLGAARQRLRALGMSDQLIADLEKNRELRTSFTVRAPFAGVLESLDVREGMTVSAGTLLARINGIDPVWVVASLPESQAGFAVAGSTVKVRLAAYPGEYFSGRILALLPQTNLETHTVRVRIELPNHASRLKPGMFAQVRLAAAPLASTLKVATEAVLHAGAQSIVLVADGAGGFTPTPVQTGGEMGEQTIIFGGVTEGQQVVASAQFLIDSEANLQGVLGRFGASPASRDTP